MKTNNNNIQFLDKNSKELIEKLIECFRDNIKLNGNINIKKLKFNSCY